MQRVLTVFLCCLALAPMPASAYVLMDARWQANRFPIVWSLDADGVDDIADESDRAEVIRAFRAWENVSCTTVTIGAPTTLTQAQQRDGVDGVNKVYWVESAWSYGRQTLGVTLPAHNGRGTLIDADILFNGDHYTWRTGSGNYCSNCTDVFSIALHEQGHFLGLDHSCSPGQQCTTATQNAIMYAAYPGRPKQTLGSDDIAGICAMYPNENATNQPRGFPCVRNSNCASGLSCLTPQGGGEAICTTSCSGTCPDGYSCEPATSGSACFRDAPVSGGTAGEGETCSETVGCATGLICIATSAGTSSGTCRYDCSDDAGICPSNQTCYSMPQQGMAVCIPGGGGGNSTPRGTQDEDCPCESGFWCMSIGGGERACKADCDPDAGDCESGLRCNAWGNSRPSGPTEGGYCHGPGTGAGAQCRPCRDDGTCGDGLVCVDYGGAKSCRQPCSATRGCGDGVRCIATPELGSVAALCSCGEPLGGEGDACTSTSACETGLTCVDDDDSRMCLRTCASSSECSDGFECLAIDGRNYCAPTGRNGPSCGCTSAGPGGVLAALALVGALVRRRRR